MTDTQDERIRIAFQKAQDYEKQYTGCAQSALAGILDSLEIKNEDLFRAASGLSDGLGLSTKGSCGALVGAALAIGLIFGRKRTDFQDPLAAMDSYDLVLDLVEQFETKIGAVRCKDIQTRLAGRSFNLREPEEFEAAIEAGMSDHCAFVAGTAAELATRIILEES
jgi:C_GCAxxG_C_C family probable redox protein